jgi:hypothetical protein
MIRTKLNAIISYITPIFRGLASMLLVLSISLGLLLSLALLLFANWLTAGLSRISPEGSKLKVFGLRETTRQLLRRNLGTLM